MKTIIKALLGASMLMPIAGGAQAAAARAGPDGQPQDRNGWQGDGPRERPANRRTMAAQAAVEAGGPERGERPAPGGPDGFRQERRDARQDFQRERQDDRQDFARERRDDRAALRNGAVSPGQFRADRRDDRQDFRADRRDDRQDFRADRRDDRQDAGRTQVGRTGLWNGSGRYGNSGNWNGNRPPNGGWYGNRGGGDGRGWNGGAYGNRSGGWTRDWRNDRRYDWNRYRGSNRNAYRLPRYYAPQGWGYGYRRFSIGVTLSSVLWGQDYWIDDPYAYRLPDAYGPYRWVRYYNDALLVDIRSGRVVDMVNDIFW